MSTERKSKEILEDWQILFDKYIKPHFYDTKLCIYNAKWVDVAHKFERDFKNVISKRLTVTP